eukprot:TRINITY_DN465_c0_g1_i2.p1 TRINITY_DN465_c0_g1~~TRINITY_DN465_c0_g1_i2.p1  ORF type:complete len:501 (-),score=120.24 TRINITY_DN465_c0_g1_i2:286-1788(-)
MESITKGMSHSGFVPPKMEEIPFANTRNKALKRQTLMSMIEKDHVRNSLVHGRSVSTIGTQNTHISKLSFMGTSIMRDEAIAWNDVLDDMINRWQRALKSDEELEDIHGEGEEIHLVETRAERLVTTLKPELDIIDTVMGEVCDRLDEECNDRGYLLRKIQTLQASIQDRLITCVVDMHRIVATSSDRIKDLADRQATVFDLLRKTRDVTTGKMASFDLKLQQAASIDLKNALKHTAAKDEARFLEDMCSMLNRTRRNSNLFLAQQSGQSVVRQDEGRIGRMNRDMDKLRQEIQALKVKACHSNSSSLSDQLAATIAQTKKPIANVNKLSLEWNDRLAQLNHELEESKVAYQSSQVELEEVKQQLCNVQEELTELKSQKRVRKANKASQCNIIADNDLTPRSDDGYFNSLEDKHKKKIDNRPGSPPRRISLAKARHQARQSMNSVSSSTVEKQRRFSTTSSLIHLPPPTSVFKGREKTFGEALMFGRAFYQQVEYPVNYS